MTYGAPHEIRRPGRSRPRDPALGSLTGAAGWHPGRREFVLGDHRVARDSGARENLPRGRRGVDRPDGTSLLALTGVTAQVEVNAGLLEQRRGKLDSGFLIRRPLSVQRGPLDCGRRSCCLSQVG
jgi:hypothetical protein